MNKNVFIFLLGGIILNFSSCGSRGSSEQQEKKVYYLEDHSSYYDADGVKHYKGDIFAPRPGESRNDDSYQQRMHRGKYAPEQSQYDEGYEAGYRDGLADSD